MPEMDDAEIEETIRDLENEGNKGGNKRKECERQIRFAQNVVSQEAIFNDDFGLSFILR